MQYSIPKGVFENPPKNHNLKTNGVLSTVGNISKISFGPLLTIMGFMKYAPPSLKELNFLSEV